MSTVTLPTSLNQGLQEVQGTFCAVILPAVERQAKIAFRDVRDHSRREELTAETVGLAWKWHVRLVERGKDATQFPTVLASYAARAVRDGRGVCGQGKGSDVLSPVGQRLHGFTVGKLPDCSSLSGNALEEALHDNSQTPVPDQAAFRLDFPAWLASQGHRNRQIAEAMALGHRTEELADTFGLSAARVSQLRREFHGDWRRFHGEGAA
jgi:hypothetical protein